MSPRRRIAAVWAALCLAGLATTAVLSGDPYADGPEFPAEGPTASPSGPHVDCEDIADAFAEERAQSAATAAPAASPASPVPPSASAFAYDGGSQVTEFTVRALPEECRSVLAERGLTTP
ncbi:hypothetical protein [Streptomyces sp. CRN 30]|uniref:hypothetical protein n=1 Tax=Streptomyces sp. CRN 30 TaxID=3075613 RepID=UPI002A7EA5C7|nr:hypothetical protein [Streptomyces sp. CRN 30]